VGLLAHLSFRGGADWFRPDAVVSPLSEAFQASDRNRGDPGESSAKYRSWRFHSSSTNLVKRVPFAAAIRAAAIHSGLLRAMAVKELAENVSRSPRVAGGKSLIGPSAPTVSRQTYRTGREFRPTA
jgi:hypothetical protein